MESDSDVDSDSTTDLNKRPRRSKNRGLGSASPPSMSCSPELTRRINTSYDHMNVSFIADQEIREQAGTPSTSVSLHNAVLPTQLTLGNTG